MVAFELSVGHFPNLAMCDSLVNELLYCALFFFLARGQCRMCIPVCALVTVSFDLLPLAVGLSNTLTFI
jgi:hypothetical protein